MDELEDKFSELHRRASVTSKARYCASRRLRFSHVMSQWSVTLLSVGLIAVSLIGISDIQKNFTNSTVEVTQIIFAVLILAYSLLLALGDYSARAVKIHRCGMELGKIARSIRKAMDGDSSEADYERILNEYYECLEKYENHEECDYLEARLKNPKLFEVPGRETSLFFKALETTTTWCSYHVKRYLPTLHYVAVPALVYAWLYALIR